MRFSKKGQAENEVMFVVLQGILAIIACTALLLYILSFKDAGIYHKNYLAKDIAILITTLDMAPGNIYFEYEYPNRALTDFDFYFRPYISSFPKNTVVIGDSVNQTGSREKSEKSPISKYPYAVNTEMRNDLINLKEPDRLYFIKSGDLFINNRNTSLNRLNFNKVSVNRKPSKILFDFSYDSDDENRLLSNTVRTLPSRFFDAKFTVSLAQVIDSKSGKLIKSDRINDLYQEADLIIIFSLKKVEASYYNQDKVDYIKIHYYFNGIETFSQIKYLGDLLGNKILDSFYDKTPNFDNKFYVANTPANFEFFKSICNISDNFPENADIINIEIGYSSDSIISKGESYGKLAFPVGEAIIEYEK